MRISEKWKQNSVNSTSYLYPDPREKIDVFFNGYVLPFYSFLVQ